MVKAPFDLDIYNLIDDLRNFSWEASETMLYYAKKVRNPEKKKIIVKTTSNQDPVTLADLKVNELIIQRLNEKYENLAWGILSEENVKFNSKDYTSKSFPEWLWVIDPLDGTKDFIQGTGNYAMHIALNFQRRPLIGAVLIPEKDELWITDGKRVWCEKSDGSKQNIILPKNKTFQQMTIVSSKNHRNKILESLIENDMSISEIVKQGHDFNIVKKIEKLVYQSEYKRFQSAPGVHLTKKSFQLSRRYPIVQNWRDKL